MFKSPINAVDDVTAHSNKKRAANFDVIVDDGGLVATMPAEIIKYKMPRANMELPKKKIGA